MEIIRGKAYVYAAQRQDATPREYGSRIVIGECMDYHDAEHVSAALGKSEVRAIVAQAFSPSFLTECFRIGIIPLRSRESLVGAIKTGDDVELHLFNPHPNICRRLSGASWVSFPLLTEGSDLEFAKYVANYGGFERFLRGNS